MDHLCFALIYLFLDKTVDHTDKFEMVVQAFEYEKEHLLAKEEAVKKQGEVVDGIDVVDKGAASLSVATKKQRTEKQSQQQFDVRTNVCFAPLRGFFISTKSTMRTPMFCRLDTELRERRKKMIQERGWTVTAQE